MDLASRKFVSTNNTKVTSTNVNFPAKRVLLPIAPAELAQAIIPRLGRIFCAKKIYDSYFVKS